MENKVIFIILLINASTYSQILPCCYIYHAAAGLASVEVGELGAKVFVDVTGISDWTFKQFK